MRSASPQRRDQNEEGGTFFRDIITNQQEDRKRIIALEKMITQMDTKDIKTQGDVKELQDQFAPDAFAKHMNNVMDNNLNEKLVI